MSQLRRRGIGRPEAGKERKKKNPAHCANFQPAATSLVL